MDISPVIDDWGLSELVPIYRRTRSSPCWSEGQASADRLQREELNDRQENSGILEQPLSSPSIVERQDIPVPQESLLRDVGLTVYTPHPQKGAPEESFSSLTLTADTQPARERQSDKPLSQDPPWASEVPNPEARDAPNFERTHATITARRQRFRFSSEGSAFLTEGPIAFSPNGHDEEDEVLEALLSRVKKRPPSEDLSPLYQVQSASGIPQNESIEERAARILGICVPADSLVLMGQSKEETSDDPPSANQNEVLQVAELVSTNQDEGEQEEDLVLANAEKPDGTEKEEEADEREEDGEEEKGETQGEVEEEEKTAAVGETAVPRETTEEGEPNVREGVTTEKWEITEGESVTAEETTETVTAEETTEPEESMAIRQEETGVTGETAASEEETVELSVSDDRTGEEEELAAARGDVIEEEVAGSEVEISGSVVVSAEVVEAGEDIPDDEIQQVSGELAEPQLARCLEEELIEEASGSPDSCVAMATLEMPEILSIVEEEEDEDAELGMYGTDRRIDCLQERTEALSYTPLYLTLGHTERKAGVDEEVQLEEEEAIEDVRGAEEERQIKEDGEEEHAPEKEMRPMPLPRSTVVKREICLPLEALEDPDTYPTPEEICLPLEALEDPDTYPTSDSYDPSRVERV
ncbi:protein Ycf2-like isoform X2 [Clupea harengus]|uniref:Protein Ycf2-like isoform X2 n=1 Tax=Clupea harengus TaxID=7950 RepID=A0A6P8GLV9_CLUHA|nr:protein Ycf2-like isoform X2 [Clupea harengus]